PYRQQLAKLEKPVKLHNTANVPQAQTTATAPRVYFDLICLQTEKTRLATPDQPGVQLCIQA
ncbi:MAG: hypothetical protein VW175_04375, partial [Alphaproteobacteria bacterium]